MAESQSRQLKHSHRWSVRQAGIQMVQVKSQSKQGNDLKQTRNTIKTLEHWHRRRGKTHADYSERHRCRIIRLGKVITRGGKLTDSESVCSSGGLITKWGWLGERVRVVAWVEELLWYIVHRGQCWWSSRCLPPAPAPPPPQPQHTHTHSRIGSAVH